MMDVLIVWGLLGLTFGMMFVVSVLGVSAPEDEQIEPEDCYICEDVERETTVRDLPLCDGCESEFFSE